MSLSQIIRSTRRLSCRVGVSHVHCRPGPSSPASASELRLISNLSDGQTKPNVHVSGASTPSAGTGSTGASLNPVLHRYLSQVESGKLQRDPQQLALIHELAQLYDDICSYKARMDAYHRATEEHQARRLARLTELLAEEARLESEQRQQQRQQQLQGQQQFEQQHQQQRGWGGWLRSTVAPIIGPWAGRLGLGLAEGASHGVGGGSGGDTPLARARQAAARREEVLQRELGPLPTAPEPPQGLYVHGSVGSGKSMLVALFYQALVETAQLPASRWMHFNAAMLEVHSRLHHLDTERWRLREERERLHHQHRLNQQQHQHKDAQAQQQQQQTQAHHAQGQLQQQLRGQQQPTQPQQQLRGQQQPTQPQQQEGVPAAGGCDGGGGGGGGGRGNCSRAAATSAPTVATAPTAAASIATSSSERFESGPPPVSAGTVVAGGGGGECRGAGYERAAYAVAEGDGGEEEDEEEEELAEEDAAVAAAEGLPVRPDRQGVFLHWDPRKDPEVQRQREAKAAMLAIRRHMRLARLGRHDPRTLAAANAQGMVRMAASFIRGRPGEPLSGWTGGSGPIASVLYFDEVQVTDVFSAVALKGLVEALTAAGCVLVCTSNRAPGELPRHGLHEDMWQHFVDTLLQRCAVHELSSEADYRRLLLEQGRASIAAAAAASTAAGGAHSTAGAAVGASSWPPLARSYLHPSGPGSTAELERLWQARAGEALRNQDGPGFPSQPLEQPLTVPVLFGRSLEVRRSSPCGGAAWFSFGELCGRPLGPADYVALSQRFHTVFLADIPAMSMQVRDQARRFITLVDELYNARCVLVASAEVQPEELFAGAEGQEPILDLEGLQFETAVEGARLRRDATAGGGVAPVASSPGALALTVGALGGAEEQFAFRRAVSRLLEMQSPQYILGALRLRQGQGGQAGQCVSA